MGGRYLVTGVQLSMFIIVNKKERIKLFDEIANEQFIGNSDKNIKEDVLSLLEKNK